MTNELRSAIRSLEILWDSCKVDPPDACQSILDLLDHPVRGALYREALEHVTTRAEVELRMREGRRDA